MSDERWRELRWYYGTGRQHVATYDDRAAFELEANKAARDGWAISSVTSSAGHVNMGRTAAKVILTGGVGMFLGASRTKGRITVVYVREPEEQDRNDSVGELERLVKLRSEAAITQDEFEALKRKVIDKK